MTQRLNTCVAAFAALFALSLAARSVDASLLYYESFTEASYPTAYLGSTPDNGNVWYNYSGPTNDSIVAGSIDTSGTIAQSTAGGKLQFAGDDNARGLSILSGGGVGADDTTVYASFLMNIDGSSSAFTGLEFWNDTPAGGTNPNRSIRSGAFNSNYEVASDVAGSSGSAAFANATTNFVVLKFNYVAGDDTVDVFVNPTRASLLSNTPTAQISGADFSFDRVGLANINDGPTAGFVDEVRIGTALADVIAAPVIPANTILIDLGKSTTAFTTETPDDSAETWNNFAPVAGGTNGAISAGASGTSLTNLKYADGSDSGAGFALTTASSGFQGIGGADWDKDFSDLTGFPVSATRDTFYSNVTADDANIFTFSNLLTDGSVYKLTVFGALDPDVGARPDTIIQVNGVDMSYDPNGPGLVTFSGLLPDINGEIKFSVRRANSTAAAHVNVVTLTLIPEPATFAMVMLAAPMLIRRCR
ncbi:hypothetical protein HED60_17115 [Planctomycetales bacterium ZRK34]|nr:hypothetical protein HED60_17115 [Planctomycetales bacterium ZRK34]